MTKKLKRNNQGLSRKTAEKYKNKIIKPTYRVLINYKVEITD